MAYEFHYTPTGTGVISGKEVLEQTEDAINDLSGQISGDVQIAIDTANNALNVASTASTDAQNAINTANTAYTAATNAQNTANTAQNTASNALTAAQNAQNDVNALGNRVTTAEGNITQNTNAITGLTTRMGTAEGNIGNLQTAVSNAQATANTAQNTASNALTAAQNAQNDVNALGNRVTTAENNITQNTSDISGLTTRMGTAEGNITTLQNDVVTAQGTATSAQNTATMAKQQAYVLRYSSTAITDNSTIAYSTIDNTDNIKAGDKIIDVDGKIFSIVSVDSDNSTVTVGTALTNVGGVALPIGSYIQFAGSQAPDGFLVCNGGEISRTTYSALFAVIGTTYGSGDGSTTFNLPDLTDRFLQGSTTSGTIKNAGLPNIIGKISNDMGNAVGQWGVCYGSLFSMGIKQLRDPAAKSDNTFDKPEWFGFDASRSSSIYGNSSTVQPPALTCLICIKY